MNILERVVNEVSKNFPKCGECGGSMISTGDEPGPSNESHKVLLQCQNCNSEVFKMLKINLEIKDLN